MFMASLWLRSTSLVDSGGPLPGSPSRQGGSAGGPEECHHRVPGRVFRRHRFSVRQVRHRFPWMDRWIVQQTMDGEVKKNKNW